MIPKEVIKHFTDKDKEYGIIENNIIKYFTYGYM